MTNVQPSIQQDSLSNMLSPEAKEFVPRQFSDGPSQSTQLADGLLGAGPAGMVLDEKGLPQQAPVNGLPSYMTTCYPFVTSGEQRFGCVRPRHRGKFPQQQQAMFMSQQFQPMQPGIPRNRFPHPAKGFVPTSAWGPTPMGDMLQSYGNVPNGMPFDGGTYQNGYLHTSLPQMTGPEGKAMLSPRETYTGDSYVETPHLINGYIDPAKLPWKTKHKQEDKASSDGTMKVCYKSSSVQTDFPEHIANATLEESPNTLFNNGQVAYKDHHTPGSRRTRHSSNRSTSDAEIDNSVFHRQNTVSNGTNPATDFIHGIGVAMVIPDHGTGQVTNFASSSSAYSVFPGAFSNMRTGFQGQGQSDSLNAMHGTVSLVPYLNDSNVNASFRPSYASIAQSQPSQNHKQNLVAMATNKSDRTNCDNSVTINRTKSAKKNSKSNNRSASRLGNVNVNVAEIMQDLERADSKRADSALKLENAYQKPGEIEMGPGKFLYSSAVKEQPKAESQKSNVLPISQISQKNSKLTESKGQSQYSQGHFQGSEKKVGQTQIKSQQSGPAKSQFKGHSQTSVGGQASGHGQLQVKGQNVQSDSNKSDLDLDKKGQSQSDNNVNQGEGEVKKKKRRRRRRKKKTGEVTAENDDDNAGASEEITLHFEDEEEFPDLSGVASGYAEKSSLFNASTVSYSDILTSNNIVQSTKSSSQDEQCSPDTTGVSPVKESRSSRKRRKRREVANKAADAEMAEINLEQHMLELKMKQKLPLTAKKSVSPVRNAPSQGVWKLTPSSPTSQPSSSGKKVSLLLPGTVAQEPSHSSTPHQPNTSAVKQPGILKTSQIPPPPASSGKKSKQPITYDLGALIDALESKKEQTPPPKKETKAVVIKKEEVKALNALDSNAPTVKRGKERETPKIKKPSPLKKVILKEREEKKRLRLLDEDEVASGAPVGIGVVSGGESDLSQDASFKGSMEVGLGTPASAELSPISQQSPSCMSPMSPGASPLSSGVNSPVTGTIQQTVKLKIHSRRFREYCNQVLDKEIDNHVTALLQDLVRFQDKQYHKDPVKAKAKRRFVLGLREVTKHLKLKKIKCVVISPNLEKIQSKGGLDDALNLILELCNDQKVPFIFALGRRALGRACAKLVPVSVVGIFNYEGSEENFKSLVALTEKARDAYREMIVQIEKEIAEHPPRTCIPGVPHIFAHMGHSRTPSGCSVISFTSSILSEPISENYPHSEPETDNRGYEIEKEDDIDDDGDRYNDDGKDPYEADDERGYHKTKKTKKIYSENSKTEGYVEGNHKSEGDTQRENTDVNGNRFDENEKLVNCNSVENKDQGEMEKTYENELDSDSDDEDDIEDGEDKCDDGDNVDNDESDNDSDFNSCDNNSDDVQTNEDEDTVEALPTFIDSVHHFDLTEILSQHSSKTMENGEDVMSTHSSKTTHSSRTLGDSSGLAGDKTCKKLDMKNVDKSGSLSIKAKSGVDKDLKEHRTRSWVKEAQNFNFNDQMDSPRESEENAVEVKNVSIECLDAVA
ncbi:uncharacterized protein LOC123542996 isoform X2 [Mercenaria mercenaria]|uniref:uncharacterized protein LOC123542996 isoform X2 n=1 Tax=Mercenaria mercenaria TaxID=6596 RepID=UPI00234E5F6D|nr:uncharacterized protein LOC123542996 isoform X2 [Mercenaria mercenaria]